MKRQLVPLLRCAIALTCAALAAPVAARDGRFHVTRVASTLVQRGLAAAAPRGAEAAAFARVPPPRIEFRPATSQATAAPWIESNGWRFQRGIKKANYAKLPAGSAPLAAAEAFTFDIEAILNPDPADVESLGNMLQFLKALDQPALPDMANIGVVDDRSPELSEILNLLTRRNLLYRVVSAPDRSLNLNVQLGSPEFPREAAADPSEFAARVRAKLGDDNRLVRLYGTSTVVAHLTGDEARARLYLLSYGGDRRQQRGQAGIRVRLLGRYEPVGFAGFEAEPGATLTDVDHPGNTTEFSVPSFVTCATIDLRALK
jgi:hypothetical protein